jgi:hypothetical protein
MGGATGVKVLKIKSRQITVGEALYASGMDPGGPYSNGQVGRIAYGSQVIEKPLDQISFRDVDRCHEQQHHGGRLRQVSVQTVAL